MSGINLQEIGYYTNPTSAIGLNLHSIGYFNNGLFTDTTPPSVPTEVITTTVSDTSIQIDWTASPEEDVDGYTIYRDDVALNSCAAGTTYTDTGLDPATSYTYGVAACDTSGNVSAPSTGVTGATRVNRLGGLYRQPKTIDQNAPTFTHGSLFRN